ncbi:MAG TPA: PEP/pyruvate-binding domain-containing protein, partial [Promineifilum sp.]|nr:PEP/pyruvate-binding domain-containing protein [Promineifilum sp.]
HHHHLEEIKVVLIKRLMSDQLPFIGVAKHVLAINDLRRIHQSRIGTGKIGGKAAGMYLAWRSLQPVAAGLSADLAGRAAIHVPDSAFIGTDVIYEFLLMNRLEHYMNQKYRPVQEIRDEYPDIVAAFMGSELPEYVVAEVSNLVNAFGDNPIVVRSSSLLEDNFGFAFAGKYDSFYCGNQGTPAENLRAVLDAIRLVYASALNPDALLYRRKHNLIDYDERLAILIQRVTGHWHGNAFYPDLGGVAFSQNPFAWAPEIRADQGFLRLVTGMSLRAVERVSQDYPRLVALSHPWLRPENTLDDKRRFSQRFMAVIDRATERLATMPVREGLADNGPLLTLVASRDTGNDLAPVPPRTSFAPDEHFVLTFEELTRDTAFIDLMRRVLAQLELVYGNPMNLEFAVNIDWSETPAEDARVPSPFYHLHILECRPLYRRDRDSDIPDLTALRDNHRLFAMPTLLPSVTVGNIEYLVFVDPDSYYSLPDGPERRRVADTVTALNDLLPAGRFGIVGPGRWGNLDSRHSVPVTYSDICNSKLLVEISPAYTPPPELAYGTDFYEDVVEAGIVVVGVQPGQPGSEMDWALLRHSPNRLAAFVPSSADLADIVRVIDLRGVAGSSLRLVIDSDANEAVACFDIPG